MIRTDRTPRRRLDPDSRRVEILTAAAGLFASQPYPEVTIGAVAAAANSSGALVYRYFGGKDELYTEIVEMAMADLAAAQQKALEALASGASVRDQVAVTIDVYLSHIRSHPQAWAFPLRYPGAEPVSVATLRTRVRMQYVARLRSLLNPSHQARHEYALVGFFGFLDAACLRWVEKGCSDDERWPLIDAALGSLEGALGDWAA